MNKIVNISTKIELFPVIFERLVTVFFVKCTIFIFYLVILIELLIYNVLVSDIQQHNWIIGNLFIL